MKGVKYTWKSSWGQYWNEEECLSKIFSEKYKFNDKTPPLHKNWQQDFQDAVKLIKKHRNNKIVVCGDYDVDGISGSSLLHHYFKYHKINFLIHIPNRFSEGYGLSKSFLQNLDCDLLITVDNGTRAIREIQDLRNRGIDVLILDHHSAGKILPNANVIVNFKIKGHKTFYELCATGVVFFLLICLEFRSVTEHFSLVAMATVCDIMPMSPINYYLISRGIKSAKSCNWIKLLYLGNEINEDTFGYYLGPIINSAGRMRSGNIALKFLTTESPLMYLSTLLSCNAKRKEVENEFFSQLRLKYQESSSDPVLVIYQWNIPEGIIGILASRFRDLSQKPTFIFTNSQDSQYYKASARSLNNNLHLGNFITKYSSLFVSGGGHAMAGGVTIHKDQFAKFCDITRTLKIHNIVEPREYIQPITPWHLYDENIWKLIEKWGPYGKYRPKPIFFIQSCNIEFVRYSYNGQHAYFLLRFQTCVKRFSILNILRSPLKVILNKKKHENIGIMFTFSQYEKKMQIKLIDIIFNSSS